MGTVGRAAEYTPYPWSVHKAGGGVPPVGTARVPTRSDMARNGLMGNSVVPDAVRYAFLFLLSRGQTIPTSLGARAGLQLVPAAAEEATPAAAVPGRPWPNSGIVASRSAAARASSAVLTAFRPPAAFRIVLDPHAFCSEVPPSKALTTRMLAGPVEAMWSTPRHSMTRPCNYLTERSVRDLPTQVRFERDTPEEARVGGVAPEFSEYLMGFPVGWTEVAA